MAKKKQEKKAVENVDIEALVDEGKNVTEVITTFEDKEEDNKEVEIEDLVQEAKDAQAEEIIATVVDGTEKEVEEDSAFSFEKMEGDDPDNVEEEYGIEGLSVEEESNIDDVIAECTGGIEAEEESVKVEDKKEPWYIARAKRISDYYNW